MVLLILGLIGVLLGIAAFVCMIAACLQGNEETKTISRKKTKQLVRKAVKANEIPQQFRRYNF